MHWNEFARVALACYFTFVALFYTMRLLALNHKFGKSFSDYGSKGTWQYVTHKLFHIFRSLIWIVCIVRVIRPELDYYLVVFKTLDQPFVAATGLIYLFISLGSIIYIDMYMGRAWRSGVDKKGPPELIITGPFGLVRHPLFVMVGLGQLGFFLSIPSAFSLICLSIGWTCLIIQAKYEEKRHTLLFGEVWARYKEAVPLIWPRLRRLPQSRHASKPTEIFS